MERPKIKDKNVLEYVEYLEDIVASFDIESLRYRSYRSMIQKIDEINELLSQSKFTDTNPITGEEAELKIISWETLTDKDDKFVDRIKIFMKDLPDWIDGAEGLLKDVTKEKIEVEEVRYRHKTQDLFKGRK